MLRPPGPASSKSRPLDLTVQRDVSTSLFVVQQSPPPRLRPSAILQSSSNTLRPNPSSCHASASSELELRFRSYSIGPARCLAEAQGCCPRSAEELHVYSQWVDEKLESRRLAEMLQRHPGVVSPCWTSARADHGQFIILVIFIQ